MQIMVCVVAAVTALGGAVLAGVWIKAGGMARPAPSASLPEVSEPDPPDRTRFSIARVAVHAILGLGAVYLVVSEAVER